MGYVDGKYILFASDKNISSLWKSKRADGISETGYENAKVVYDKVLMCEV